MAETAKPEQSCDDIAFLISRNMDGDLNRIETLQLYEHLAACDSCRTLMRQMSALGRSMDRLRTHYQGYSPSNKLTQSIHDTISKQKKRHPSDSPHLTLMQKLRTRSFFSILFKPAFGIPGTLVVLGFTIFMGWQGVFQQSTPAERLIVHDIPLRSAEDRVNWNQQYTIPPSRMIRLNIRQSNQEPYFFQVSSAQPVGYSVTHNQDIQDARDLQRMDLQGIQYLILRYPQLQDTVNIYNRGNHPISLKTYSNSPQAMQANFK
ncbi:zf-HC2 domain-containing protein [bacterium]|nr:zf-HC2 domain-containing protein [bacterium]